MNLSSDFYGRNRTKQDLFGLNIHLFNELERIVKQLYKREIFIEVESIKRAVYFHGYLLEQTLQVFDISELSSVRERKLTNAIQESRQTILRRILLFSKVLIMKESFYSTQGKKHQRSSSSFPHSLLL